MPLQDVNDHPLWMPRTFQVASWPGVIASGASTRVLFSFYDFLPTAADFAGLPQSEWGPTDGASVKSALLANTAGGTTTDAPADDTP